jgi:hypothetical protein
VLYAPYASGQTDKVIPSEEEREEIRERQVVEIADFLARLGAKQIALIEQQGSNKSTVVIASAAKQSLFVSVTDKIATSLRSSQRQKHCR